MLSMFLVCAVATTSADIRAAPARKSFVEAEEAAKAGLWSKAASLFAEAFREEPHAHAAHNAAQALLRAGDAHAALAWLDEAARAPGNASLPKLDKQRRDLALSIAAASADAWLRVHSVPPGGSVEVDAQTLGETPMTLRLVPGRHDIRVVLGGRSLGTQLVLDPGATQELWLSPPRRGARSVAAGGLAISAASSLGLGIYFGSNAQQSSRSLRAGLHEQPEAQRLFDAARRDAVVANVLIGVSAALGVTGGWLFWTDGWAE